MVKATSLTSKVYVLSVSQFIVRSNDSEISTQVFIIVVVHSEISSKITNFYF